MINHKYDNLVSALEALGSAGYEVRSKKDMREEKGSSCFEVFPMTRKRPDNYPLACFGPHECAILLPDGSLHISLRYPVRDFQKRMIAEMHYGDFAFLDVFPQESIRHGFIEDKKHFVQASLLDENGHELGDAGCWFTPNGVSMSTCTGITTHVRGHGYGKRCIASAFANSKRFARCYGLELKWAAAYGQLGIDDDPSIFNDISTALRAMNFEARGDLVYDESFQGLMKECPLGSCGGMLREGLLDAMMADKFGGYLEGDYSDLL
jgi:hypothetical protein